MTKILKKFIVIWDKEQLPNAHLYGGQPEKEYETGPIVFDLNEVVSFAELEEQNKDIWPTPYLHISLKNGITYRIDFPFIEFSKIMTGIFNV